MTGEMTLQGYVLPVGGIKEKCFAALRNNIKRIILSGQNKDDVEELPKEVKKELKFIFVKDIKEVIKNAFSNVKVFKDNNNSILFEKTETAKF
jgi:ATP-dependent Lon protease